MKYFILIVTLYLVGCSDAKKEHGPFYNSLSAAVIDGLITQENRSQKTFVLITNDRKNIYAIINTPSAINKISNTFLKAHDSSELRNVVENSLFLDTTAKIAASNVRYVTSLPPDGYDWRKLDTERVLKGLVIVNYFFMLTSKDGSKCIVYFHKIRQAAQIAKLEKKNNNWYIISVERDKPEIVE